MKRYISIVLLFFLVVAPMFPMFMAPTTNASPNDNSEAPVDIDAPNISPEENVELTMMFFTETPSSEDGLYYVCRQGMDAVAYFGASSVMYLSGNTVFTLEFPGSNVVIPDTENPTGSVTNYLLGNNPSQWKTGVEDCAVLRYPDIYPGIDLVYKVHGGDLKYEFVVSPYADPNLIQMRYPDASMLDVYDGRITVWKSEVSFSDTGLWAFQDCNEAVEVACAFQPLNMNTIEFHVGHYDETQELIIDPILVYSTFLGGTSDDYGYSIAVESGFVYITGYTSSSDFPTYNPYDLSYNGGQDCFVTKLAADGQSLVYSTFLGGTSDDYGYSIAVESGSVYITGGTYSADFPTYNPYDPSYNGGLDCFVTKLAADGQSLVYSTFLGGTSTDYGYSIAVESGVVYITGRTDSADFPTYNPYDPSYNGGQDCFVTKFAADGQSLVYSTFLGTTAGDYGRGIAVESGSAYITGYTYSGAFPTVNAYDSTYNLDGDVFVTKLAADGQSLVYSTFLGGASSDYGQDIAVESGSAYITGYTNSADFPTYNAYDLTYSGTTDCFVTKLAADGQSLAYSTFLGGSGVDQGYSIAVESGSAYITGRTDSTEFPTVNAYNSTHSGGIDCFVTKLAADGQSLVHSTFLGGTSDDLGYSIAVESGSVYITGYTGSSEFPTVNAYDSTYSGGTRDCFVSILSDDSDSDGLSDWEEELLGTDSFCIDTDNDNFLDAYEVSYGSDPLDPMSYPSMPQAWYDAIYENLDGNATLIQNLLIWSDGNATLLQIVIQQLDDNSTLLTQVISWLDGNHSAIEALFTYIEGNATLLLETITACDSNTAQLLVVAALATSNYDWLTELNSTAIGNITEIRAVLAQLGVTVGDLDYDGLDDLDELFYGTDIDCIDTDCDNLNDAFEIKIGTDPVDDDSDDDLYFDGFEILSGTDPLNPNDYPGMETTTTGTTTPITTPSPVDSPMVLILVIGTGAAGSIIVVTLLLMRKRRLSS